MVAGGSTGGCNRNHQRDAGLCRLERAGEQGAAGVRSPIDSEQLVSVVNSEAGGFHRGVGNRIAPGFDKKEGEVLAFAIKKVGNVNARVHQGDGGQSGQQAVEKDGALGRHGARF